MVQAVVVEVASAVRVAYHMALVEAQALGVLGEGILEDQMPYNLLHNVLSVNTGNMRIWWASPDFLAVCFR